MTAARRNRPIHVRHVLDEDTFLQAAHALWRKGRLSRKSRIRSTLILAALPLGAWLAMAHGMWFAFLAIVALALLHFVFDWPLTRFFVRRSFAQLPAAGRAIEWKIDDAGLNVRIDAGDWERIDWDALADITLTDRGFLLQQPHDVHHWLPAGAFASGDDLARFRRLAEHWRQKREYGRRRA